MQPPVSRSQPGSLTCNWLCLTLDVSFCSRFKTQPQPPFPDFRQLIQLLHLLKTTRGTSCWQHAKRQCHGQLLALSRPRQTYSCESKPLRGAAPAQMVHALWPAAQAQRAAVLRRRRRRRRSPGRSVRHDAAQRGLLWRRLPGEHFDCRTGCVKDWVVNHRACTCCKCFGRHRS